MHGMQFTSRCYLFCFRFEISKIRSYSFFRSLYPSCNYNRFFTVFLFFSFYTRLFVRRVRSVRSFEISIWEEEIVIESWRSYKYAFVSPRETSNKLHNGRTFTRTSKEPREQRWPSTRETFHEIIYWSIKMTHGGIR